MNIIYLRVSTNEKRQDLDQQLKAILDKFELKEEDSLIIKDEGSAYNMEKVHKRKGFLRLLDMVFFASDTSYLNFFMNDYKPHTKDINIYVWDYSRIMRNMVKNLQFFILALEYGVNIYTYKDMALYDEKAAKTNTGKLMAIINNLLIGHTAQVYSEQLSKDISRAYDKDKGGSSKGMVWGQGYTPNKNWSEHWSEIVLNNKGEELRRLTDSGRLRLTTSEKQVLDKYIKKLLEMGYMRSDVIKFVAERKGIIINAKYLSVNFRDIN